MRSLASEMRRTTDLVRAQEVASAGTTEGVEAARVEGVRTMAREVVWQTVINDLRAAADRGESELPLRISVPSGGMPGDVLEIVIPEILILLRDAGFRVEGVSGQSVTVGW